MAASDSSPLAEYHQAPQIYEKENKIPPLSDRVVTESVATNYLYPQHCPQFPHALSYYNRQRLEAQGPAF